MRTGAAAASAAISRGSSAKRATPSDDASRAKQLSVCRHGKHPHFRKQTLMSQSDSPPVSRSATSERKAMGEAPDYGIGERVDVLLVGNVGGYPHECVFPGEVSWVWERHIDVRSGEQVFRVPRPSLHGPRDNHIGGLNHDYFSF